ncbi:hypothetical protein K3152_09300 [Qipengyuania sp. 1NDH17]|uniref:DUF4345 domain-containing protein n=1 Tax=Qipengyuania polymorpha TaxID=2867234 RepID=A0ABS7J285_9SPHN|nr:hypothetical protein [Qipengyuania polymorpha]MBX7458440.1 hypothetical protein [Qipengyuania polymorpha]
MHFILVVLLALGALLNLFLGVSFFLDPATTGADFGLRSPDAQGLSSMRADFTAFFLVAALCEGWAAWKRRADILWPALALFVIAFTGRLVNLIVVGDYELWYGPMTVEALHIVVMVLAIKTFPGGRPIPADPA